MAARDPHHISAATGAETDLAEWAALLRHEAVRRERLFAAYLLDMVVQDLSGPDTGPAPGVFRVPGLQRQRH